MNAVAEINTRTIGESTLAEYLSRGGFSYLVPLQGPLFLRLTRGSGMSSPPKSDRIRAGGVKVFLIAATLIGLVGMFFHRPRVLIYANDLMTGEPFDPRMAALYRWLFSRGNFGNLVHATPGQETPGRWLRRRGPVIYYEAFEAIARLCLRIGIVRPIFKTPHESDVLVRWIVGRANTIAATMPLLRGMLGLIQPAQVWLMDDPRYWHQLVVAARQRGVRSIVFQHGRFNVHMPAITYEGISPASVPIPDEYIVWSDYWRQQLLQVSRPIAAHAATVRVGGHPGQQKQSRSYRRGGHAVVILYEPGHDPEQYRRLVEELTAIAGYHFFYKVRSDRSQQEQVSGYGLQALISGGQLQITTEMPEEIALIVGAYSTLLYEMVQAGIPVGVLKTRDTQAEDLVQADLASFIDPTLPLQEQLRHAVSVTDEQLRWRADQLAISTDIADTLNRLTTS